MRFSLDLRAIGLGVLAIIVGYLMMVIALNIGVNTVGERSMALAIGMTVIGNFLPVLPGFTSAYFARTNPTIHGLIAGGLYLLVILVVTFLSGGVHRAMLVSVVAVMLVVWLGTIFGRYARTRREP